MNEQQTTKLDAWVIATRPHTLPAAAAPVLVGSGVSFYLEVFSLLPAFVALLGAMLIQIGTNLANDYFDAKKGVDTDQRTGFTRVTHEGLLSPETVKRGMITVFSLAVICGVYLTIKGGWPILAIGVTGILFGITYSGGPFPYGSYALGDLMVFLYFGVFAVWGTYYVQLAHGHGAFSLSIVEGGLSSMVLLTSLPSACLANAVLVVNNLRDLETDQKAGKYTMAVLLGDRNTRVHYSLLLIMAMIVPALFPFLYPKFPLYIVMPLVLLPVTYYLIKDIWTANEGEAFNQLLTRTGKLMLAHAILFTIGFVVSSGTPILS